MTVVSIYLQKSKLKTKLHDHDFDAIGSITWGSYLQKNNGILTRYAPNQASETTPLKNMYIYFECIIEYSRFFSKFVYKWIIKPVSNILICYLGTIMRSNRVYEPLQLFSNYSIVLIFVFKHVYNHEFDRYKNMQKVVSNKVEIIRVP